MTASKSEARWRLLLPCVLLACAPKGLPPLPPNDDPARAESPVPAYVPSPNPFTTSAFEGEAPAEAHEHEGHHGHHMKKEGP